MITATQAYTKKQTSEFWAKCEPGSRLICRSNTYRAASVGLMREVVKLQKNSLALHGESGKTSWIFFPHQRDVLSIDGNTITYRIGIEDHTATWERVVD